MKGTFFYEPLEVNWKKLTLFYFMIHLRNKYALLSLTSSISG